MKSRIMVFCATNPRIPHIYPETIQSINALKWSGPFDIILSRDDFNQIPEGDDKTKNVGEKYIRAREIFLAGDYEIMFTIESDHIIPSYALEKMASIDADIVYGLYCSRPNKKHLWLLRRGENIGPQIYPKKFMRSVWNQIVPSDGLGTGCTLIHRRVLETLKFHWTSGLGHDWHLAKDAKAAGFIQVHDCRVHVGHILKQGMAVWPDPNFTYRIESC